MITQVSQSAALAAVPTTPSAVSPFQARPSRTPRTASASRPSTTPLDPSPALPIKISLSAASPSTGLSLSRITRYVRIPPHHQKTPQECTMLKETRRMVPQQAPLQLASRSQASQFLASQAQWRARGLMFTFSVARAAVLDGPGLVTRSPEERPARSARTCLQGLLARWLCKSDSELSVTELESDVLRNVKAGDLGLCPHSCCIYFRCPIWRLEDVLSTLFIVYAQKQVPIVSFGLLPAVFERSQVSKITI